MFSSLLSSFSQWSKKHPKWWMYLTPMVVSASLGCKTFCMYREIAKVKAILIIPAQGRSIPVLKTNWERAMMAVGVCRVVVATDDNNVADGCRRFGADVMILESRSDVMATSESHSDVTTTSELHSDGMKRCIDAIPRLSKYNVLINVEGDGVIDPAVIDSIVFIHQKSPNFEGVICVDLQMLADGGHEMKATRFSRPVDA